jgi:hypothetical protein
MNDLHVHSSYIHDRIYEIRGQKVMLDFDLAQLYGTETKRLKESVRRNISRFPDDFMFELSEYEWSNLRSKIATSSWGGIRYKPFAFTEHGVAMLASVLKSDAAIQVNIAIVRAFIALRRNLIQSPDDKYEELQKSIRILEINMEEILTDQNDINEDTRIQIELINQTLAELQAGKTLLNTTPRRKIGFISNE